jgi:hypothetical protein
MLHTQHEGDFKITAVYGPTVFNRKDHFFGELVALKPPARVHCLALGDFKQICRASDKNKRNVNQSRINRFRDALQSCELSKIHLQNQRFTWSNEREDPTMCKLDAFFCNTEWDLGFGTHVLHALSFCYRIIVLFFLPVITVPEGRVFKFENFLARIPGFDEVVKRAWDKPTSHIEPCHVLHHKLKHAGKCLTKWVRGLFSNS